MRAGQVVPATIRCSSAMARLCGRPGCTAMEEAVPATRSSAAAGVRGRRGPSLKMRTTRPGAGAMVVGLIGIIAAFLQEGPVMQAWPVRAGLAGPFQRTGGRPFVLFLF